jgi:uridine kinase
MGKEFEVTVVKGSEEKKVTFTSGKTIANLLEASFGEDRRSVAAKVDGHLRELSWKIFDCEKVEFVDVSTAVGFDLYKRSLILLMLKAAKDVLNKEEGDYRIEIMYSLGKAFFCKIEDDDIEITDELLKAIKSRMQELVDQDIKIEKKIRSTVETAENFKNRDLPGKAKLLKYRLASRINIYSLDGYEDYYYGYMVPSTGYLTKFDIEAYDDGFVLRIPIRSTFEMEEKYDAPDKLYRVLRD